MIRARENPFALQAGVLALLMHGMFLFLLVFSFSWKHVQPPAAAEVELWDSLPTPKVATPPEIKPEPKPEPPPEIKPEIKPEPKPEPPPEPKAEIQVKPKPVVVKKLPKEEPKKPDPALKKQEDEKKRKDQLEKLKQSMLEDMPEQETPPADTKAQDAQKAAADAKRAQQVLSASSGIVNDYIAKITAKILSNVNNTACGSGKPSVSFSIAVLPDGHVNGTPQLIRPSGLPACDREVEHAILLAQPLPLPPQQELFDQFRTLNITLWPKGK
jgi:colicin import membrane protein